MRIERHTGPRSELRALFELAEDSAAELDGYIDAGEVLVAVEDGRRPIVLNASPPAATRQRRRTPCAANPMSA